MRLYDGALVVVIITAIALTIGLASVHFFGSDNAIEEASEEIIEQELGVDIDLSPGDEDAASER